MILSFVEFKNTHNKKGEHIVKICRKIMGNFEGKMKWHKFLAYFMLWLSAILNFGSYAMLKSGAQYGNVKDDVYDMFPSMKTADGTYAVLCLVMAIIAIVSAVCLIKFKKLGPIGVIALYAVNVISAMYYLSAVTKATEKVSSLVDLSPLKSQYTTTIITGIIMVALNVVYFSKRKDLYN